MNISTTQLANLDRPTADAAPYGIVQVDDEGKVLLYNRWESEMSGVAVGEAEGRNFFTQVAPCTNNRLVYGRFKDGVAANALDEEMNYTFTYKMRPTNVILKLVRERGKNFIVVRRAFERGVGRI